MKQKILLVYLLSLTMTACTHLSSHEVDPKLSSVNTPETVKDTPTTDYNGPLVKTTLEEIIVNTF